MLKTLGSYDCETFEFEGKQAIVVMPPKGKANGKWILKSEYWGAFPEAEIALLENGWHVAYIRNDTRFATAQECERKARFILFVSEKYSLNKKCTQIGMSCGGAHAVRFAGLYPELTACIYIDAPVLNYCSFPGKMDGGECEQIWEDEFVKAYPGIKRYQLVNSDIHPLNMADSLIRNKIPVLMVWGTEDLSVNYKENGLLFEQAYENNPLLETVCVSGRGHHPHGTFNENREIIDFIIKNG